MKIKGLALAALVVLLSGFASCKSNKKAAEKEAAVATPVKPVGKLEATTLDGTAANPPAKAEAAPVAAPPEEPTVEGMEPQLPEPQNIQEPTYPDSLFLRIQRTPCYGKCPVFTIDIYQSGYAIMEGRRFFDYEGLFTTRFHESELMMFVEVARTTGYFDLEHVYDAPVTDLPSCTTILRAEERQNWVYNRMNAPDGLRQFEMEIETLIKQRPWVPYEGKKKHFTQD